MHLSIDDLDDSYALHWTEQRSRLPTDHPHHISHEARGVIARALAGMERQCDEMIAAMLRELGEEVSTDILGARHV